MAVVKTTTINTTGECHTNCFSHEDTLVTNPDDAIIERPHARIPKRYVTHNLAVQFMTLPFHQIHQWKHPET